MLIFNLPQCSYFWFFAIVFSLNVTHHLEIYQQTKFHGPTLVGATFEKFELPPFWNC
jgi:hypothetical protein